MSRKVYPREFKVSAVKLVQEKKCTISEAARDLGVDAASIRNWLKKFGAEAGGREDEESALRAEVRRLREENKRLLMEREILKKATAFFAKQQP
jgi:transposase